MFDQMVRDFREVRAQGVTKSNALFLANSACAEAIINSELNESQRRALIGLARAGSAYEAAQQSPHRTAYRCRLEEALDNAITVLSH